MTLEEFQSLEPGMVVRIVSKWVDPEDGFQNPDGDMDKYLGTNMTIREAVDRDFGYVQMYEDIDDPMAPGGWMWNETLIDHIVYGGTPDDVVARDKEDLLSFIFQ